MLERPEVNSVNFQGFFNVYSKNSNKAQTIDYKGFILKVDIFIKFIKFIIRGRIGKQHIQTNSFEPISAQIFKLSNTIV